MSNFNPIVRNWTPFVLFILIPTFAFFWYAALTSSRIGDVGDSIANAVGETDGGIEGLRRAATTVSDLVRAVDDIHAEVAGVEPADRTPLQQARFVEHKLASVRIALASYAADESREEPIGELAQRAIASDDGPSLQQTVRELEETLADLRRASTVVESDPHSYQVYFAFDSADLTFPAINSLRAIVEDEFAGGRRQATIVAYADRSGDEQYNWQLAKQRGEAVRTAVLGVEPNLDVTLAVQGEIDVPVDPEVDGRLEPANRLTRVAFL